MFDRLDASGACERSGRARLALPVSLILHAAALGGAFAATYLTVGSIHEPPGVERIFVRPIPPGPPAPPPPPPPARADASRPPEARPVPVEPIPERIQEAAVPEKPAEAEDAAGGASPAGVEGGEEEGLPGGEVAGVRGGTLGGVLDGVPWGIPGSQGPGLPPSGAEDDPIPIVGDVRPPERIHRVDPAYPEAARLSRAEGRVILEIVVGRGGDVEEVRVLKGHPLFERAAAEAVGRWKYRPALQGGRPVKVVMTVVVDLRHK
jgi:protein TonB